MIGSPGNSLQDCRPNCIHLREARRITILSGSIFLLGWGIPADIPLFFCGSSQPLLCINKMLFQTLPSSSGENSCPLNPPVTVDLLCRRKRLLIAFTCSSARYPSSGNRSGRNLIQFPAVRKISPIFVVKMLCVILLFTSPIYVSIQPIRTTAANTSQVLFMWLLRYIILSVYLRNASTPVLSVKTSST